MSKTIKLIALLVWVTLRKWKDCFPITKIIQWHCFTFLKSVIFGLVWNNWILIFFWLLIHCVSTGHVDFGKLAQWTKVHTLCAEALGSVCSYIVSWALQGVTFEDKNLRQHTALKHTHFIFMGKWEWKKQVNPNSIMKTMLTMKTFRKRLGKLLLHF